MTHLNKNRRVEDVGDHLEYGLVGGRAAAYQNAGGFP